MCGIAGFHLKNPDYVKRHTVLEALVDSFLLGIEPRGDDATGLVAAFANGENTHLEKADITASDFIKARDPIPEGVVTVLAHTRLKTQGSEKNNDNNHPVVCNGVYVTHNGGVWNDRVLFEDKELDLKRTAEVDSEAIAALINKYGLENWKEALPKLHGGLAIAAIDPTRNPNKVLLAKGASMPLAYIHTEHFVWWASTPKVLRDAWSQILGTPPAWNKFHTLSEGEALLIDGAKLTLHKWELESGFQKTDYRPSTKDQKHGGKNGGGETNGGGTSSFTNRRFYNHTRVDHALAVGQVRSRKEGRARLEALRDTEDFSDCHEPLSWRFCYSCKQRIIAEDMQITLAWGNICFDCYDVCTSNSKNGGLSADERLELHNFCALEAEVHRQTLKDLAEETGFDEADIDYLIFRADKEYVESNKNLERFADDLNERYQEAAFANFQIFGMDGEPDPSDLSKPPEKKEPIALHAGATRFKWCATHRVSYHDSRECSECEKEFNAKDSVDKKFSYPMCTCTGGGCDNCVTKPEWCPRCLRDEDEIIDGDACGVVVEAPERAEKSLSHDVSWRRSGLHQIQTSPPLEKPRIQDAPKAQSCVVCKHKSKFVGDKFSWCGKHYNFCNRPECPLADKVGTKFDNSNDYIGEAVGTSPEGYRLCHYCFRGTAGGVQDNKKGKSHVRVVD